MLKDGSSKALFAIFSLILAGALCFALMAAYSASLSATQSSENYSLAHTVVIDPGHGGVDGGAIGYGGVVEKNINLNISLKLREFFRTAGYSVIMTREDDRSIHDDDADTIKKKKTSDLHNRLGIMRQNPQAVFISIHQNKFEQSQYSGTQVFYSGNREESKELADAIQKSVRKMLQKDNDRVIKEAQKNLFILYYAKSPAVMVECGFLSNPQEAESLQSDAYQNKMAFAIFNATLVFYAEHSCSAPDVKK